MPLDLNQYDIETLTERIMQLRPGTALVSNDGIIVRRRPNSSGYDCGVGVGGVSTRRRNTAADAASDMLLTSAKYTNAQSLGGETRFDDIDSAIESVRRGEATPSGPSPATKALRALARNTTLPSYRVRAQKARQLLSEGKMGQAVRQLEIILEHANGSGRTKDVSRAEAAIESIRSNPEYEPGMPELGNTKLEIRTHGEEHYVYKNGTPVTSGMARREAEERRRFLARESAREEEMQNIESEIAGKPILIEQAGEAA